MPRIVGAGGTPGGIGPFFGGVGLCGLGMYLLFSRVVVQSGHWFSGAFGSGFGQGASVGMTLLPFAIGLGVVFFNGKSKLGWALAAGGLLLLTIEIVTSLRIHVRPTPLLAILGMIGLIGGGMGLIVRSLKSQ
jgi:hypothetical protein